MHPGATDITSKGGDFDGNGTQDTLRAYRLEGAWRLRLELGTSGGAEVAVADTDPNAALKAVGGFNIDAGPGLEAFAIIGAGAATDIIAVWRLADCGLRRLTRDGRPSSFAVGATVRSLSGVTCLEGRGLAILSGEGDANGSMFSLTRTEYRTAGDALVLSDTSSATRPAGDPGLEPYGSLRCGTLSLQ